MAVNNGTSKPTQVNEGTIQFDSSSTSAGTSNFTSAGIDQSFIKAEETKINNNIGTGVNTDTKAVPGYYDSDSTALDNESDPTLQSIFGVGERTDLPLNGFFGSRPIEHKPRTNVLHQYATYTYNITLGAQTKEEQNRTVDSQENNPRPLMSEILMSSGGRQSFSETNGNNTEIVSSRSDIFKEDYYIQNLKITSVIGQNSYAQGSNTVQVEFDIFEPYGVSLIERLVALGRRLGHTNYLEIPFIIRIDFTGYDDNGNIVDDLPNTTKFIPIRLASMNFKVDGRGSAYQIKAIPFSQHTLSQKISSIPIGVKINASTVGDFFNQKQKAAGNIPQQGLAEVLNTWYKKRTISSKGHPATRTVADKIIFEVHPEIAKATITTANLAKVAETNKGNKAVQDGAKANGSINNANKAPHTFHEKSSIVGIINTIIKNSTYFLKQLKEGEASPEKDNSFVDIRITTSHKLGEYDDHAKRRAWISTFYINPYDIKGQKNNIGQQRKPAEKYIAKYYDYYYTGKNQDIIDLDVAFNLAVYVERSTGLVDVANTTGAKKNRTQVDLGNAPPESTDPITNATPYEDGQASKGTLVGLGSKENIQKMKAAELRDSIMSDSYGDMMNLQLTIFGDPEFIKQDDIFIKTKNITGDRVNGSLIMDNGELYIRLAFKIKEDPDHQTGLRLEDTVIPGYPKKRESAFNGIFKVLTLENNFADGSFKQTMTIVRIYNQ